MEHGALNLLPPSFQATYTVMPKQSGTLKSAPLGLFYFWDIYTVGWELIVIRGN